MKRDLMLIAVVPLMFTAILGEAAGQTFKMDEYHEDSGNRILLTSNEQIDHDGFTGSVFVAASFARINSEDTESYSFHIEVHSNDGFEMFTADSVNFFIDDEREQYKLFVSAAERREESNFESGFIQLKKTEFEKFGKATDLRFRIHNNDFTVSQNAKDAFLLVLNTLKE
jgi:hypothetical protein